MNLSEQLTLSSLNGLFELKSFKRKFAAQCGIFDTSKQKIKDRTRSLKVEKIRVMRDQMRHSDPNLRADLTTRVWAEVLGLYPFVTTQLTMLGHRHSLFVDL